MGGGGKGGGGGKKGGGNGDYFRYYMSLHVGIANQVDEVKALVMGDRAIWKGSVRQSKVFNISKENIFGGGRREGGVSGAITFLMGEDHQFMPLYLLEKLSSVAANVPSYRGMTSIFFHDSVKADYNGALIGDTYDEGQSGGFDIRTAQYSGSLGTFLSNARAAIMGGSRGFYFQANNPYLRQLKVLCYRRAKGLNRGYSEIARGGGTNDTNPAHIIYELQTNQDFGAGLPMTRVNVESFELAAQTLYNEGFGLSFKWISQGRVKDMILEVLDHINAIIYEDPATGLLTLKLLRDDYNVNTIPTADHTNCTVRSFQRRSEELINEVVVTYTNGETYEETSVTVQDLAGIAAQGGVVSTSRNYYGVHKTVLAKNLGERDLRAESYPLATAEIDFFREFWDLRPGDVLKLDSPEDSDEIIIMRVMEIEGDPAGHGMLRGKLVQDVFSLTAAPIFTTPDPIIDYDETDPNEAEAVQSFTMPYSFGVLAGLIESGVDNYPVAHLAVLAASSQDGIDFYDLESEIYGAMGNDRFDIVATNTISPRGLLSSGLSAEVESTVAVPALSNGRRPEPEFLAIIGTGGDEDLEIAGVVSVTDGDMVLRRGIFDTVPREWPANTPVWFVSASSSFWDPIQRSAFEDVEFKVLPLAVGGALDPSSATLLNFTLGERYYQPYRPANVQLEGTAFGTYVSPDRDPKEVTWANRYRQGEDAVILAWDDATVTPEPGQTTEIDVLRASDRTVLQSYTGLTGTSYTIPYTAWQGESEFIIQVWSERDGYRSLQAHEIVMEMPSPPGWGASYGSSWGA
jgi:hypothetical protein